MEQRTLVTGGGAAYVVGALVSVAALAGPTIGSLPRWASAGVVGSVGLVVGPLLALRALERVDVTSIQGRIRPVLALFSPALVLVLAAIVLPAGRADFEAVLGPAIVGSGLAVAGAVAIAHASERAHADRIVAESDVVAHLPGRYEYLWRQHRLGLVVAGALVGSIYVWALWQLRGQLAMWLGLLGGLAVGAPLLTNRELTVTDSGIVEGVRLHEWDRYERFEVTEDALVLHQPGFGSKTTFPLDRIEDLDAVVDALERHLERLEP